MRKLILIVLIFSISLFSKIVVARPVVRIVSLKPAITDVLVAMGDGNMLVGVTRYCDMSKLKKTMIVGDYIRPYIERIASLAPDIVLASKENSDEGNMAALRRLGLKIRFFPFGSIADTFASIRGIGEAIGDASGANKLILNMKLRLDALKKIVGDKNMKKPMNVVVIVGLHPMMAVGDKSYIGELLSYAGLKNAVASNVAYPKIGLEGLFSADPDIIVDLSMSGRNYGGRFWRRFKSLSAVRLGRVYHMGMTDFRAGPRMIDGLYELTKMIYQR